jgi:hypothetical protein
VTHDPDLVNLAQALRAAAQRPDDGTIAWHPVVAAFERDGVRGLVHLARTRSEVFVTALIAVAEGPRPLKECVRAAAARVGRDGEGGGGLIGYLAQLAIDTPNLFVPLLGRSMVDEPGESLSVTIREQRDARIQQIIARIRSRNHD